MNFLGYLTFMCIFLPLSAIFYPEIDGFAKEYGFKAHIAACLVGFFGTWLSIWLVEKAWLAYSAEE